MKRKNKLLILFILVIGILAIPTLVKAWTITPSAQNSGLHMQVHTNGYLYWDAVPQANGYTIRICDSIGYNCKSFISNTNSYDIITPMNNMKKDSAYYRFEVASKGVSGSGTYDTMSYYYTSPFEKLEAPTNVKWVNEFTIMWDPVLHATSYEIAVGIPRISASLATSRSCWMSSRASALL